MSKKSAVHLRIDAADQQWGDRGVQGERQSVRIVHRDIDNFRTNFDLFRSTKLPEVRLEILEPFSFMGKIALRRLTSGFTIAEYSTGQHSHSTDQSKFRVGRTAAGWLLDRVVGRIENSQYTNAIVLATDGIVWQGAYKAYGEDGTLGVIGEGRSLEDIMRDAIANPESYRVGKDAVLLHSVTNRLIDSNKRT